MNEQLDPKQYFENPDGRLRRPFVTNWTRVDVIVLMITSTLSMVALMTLGGLVGLLCAGFLMLFNLRGSYGRGYDEFWSGLASCYIQLVLRDTLFLAEDPSEQVLGSGFRFWLIKRYYGVVRFLREKRYRRPSKRYVFPLRLDQIVLRDDDGNIIEDTGVIQQQDRNLVHIVVKGGGSDFASHEQSRQHELSNGLAANIDLVAASSPLRIGMSYARLTRPVNSYRTDMFMAGNGQPLYFSPEYFELNEDITTQAARFQEAYQQIIHSQRENGVGEVWALAVPAIKRTREMERAAQGKLTDASLSELPILELGRQVVEAVEGSGMNVRDVHCLSFDELRVLFRAAWCVNDLDFHQTRSQKDSSFSAYPQRSITVGNDFICMDDNWITTLRIVRKPKQFDITAIQDVFHGSNMPKVWSSMVTAGEAISGTMETNTLIYRQSLDINLQSAFKSGRIVQNPKVARRQKELQRQTEAFSAVTSAQQYNDVFSIVAASQKEMVAGRKATMSRLKAAGFMSEVIRGRSRQLDAAITGILAVNRL